VVADDVLSQRTDDGQVAPDLPGQRFRLDARDMHGVTSGCFGDSPGHRTARSLLEQGVVQQFDLSEHLRAEGVTGMLYQVVARRAEPRTPGPRRASRRS